jgi:hypothetical protein
MRKRALAVLAFGLLLVAGSGATIGVQMLAGQGPAQAVAPEGGRGGFVPALAALPAGALRLVGLGEPDADLAALAPEEVETLPLAAPEPGEAPSPPVRPAVRRGADGAAEGFACAIESGARRCRAGG